MNQQKSRQSERERRADKESTGRSGIERRTTSNSGADGSGRRCPYCGAVHSATARICPDCGMRVCADECTFCGCAIPAGASHCPECGNPTDGIECPECGTINFRSFCRKCGAALNSRALTALERVRQHPNFRRALELVAELAQLQEDAPVQAESHNPLEAARQRLRRLASAAKTATPAALRKTTPVRRVGTLDEASRLYAEKRAELDALLDSIVPPAELSPEEQRDYCSARMVAVERTEIRRFLKPRCWVCNYCGMEHDCPSDCAEPWHGGTWVYDEEDVAVSKISFEPLKD